MPPLSRWIIRLSLVNAWFGATLAAVLLSNKGHPELFPDWIGGWILAHVNLLLVGWMVQLAIGVVYWIMPRLPNSGTERGRYASIVSVPILLNAGVWLYSLCVMLAHNLPEWTWLQIVGLLLQLGALLAFAYHLWPRIRAAIAS